MSTTSRRDATATGDLNSTDVDDNNPSDAWIAVGTTASTKGYGIYTLTDAGLWTYTLDNSNADVQALNVGEILSDTFTVTTVDGTSKAVIIIISGHQRRCSPDDPHFLAVRLPAGAPPPPREIGSLGDLPDLGRIRLARSRLRQQQTLVHRDK